MGLLLAYRGQSNFRVTYCLGWFFSGGSIGGEGSWLVQNCLGKGEEEQLKGSRWVCRREHREALALGTVRSSVFSPTFSLGHPGLPFPLLSVPEFSLAR